jgi:hypothetical protein
MFSKTQKPPLGQQINWSHPLSKGLVGCWLMNEGSGNKIYDSVSKKQNVTWEDNPTWSAKGGLVFDGSNDAIQLSTPLQILSTSASTIMFYTLDWVQTDYTIILDINDYLGGHVLTVGLYLPTYGVTFTRGATDLTSTYRGVVPKYSLWTAVYDPLYSARWILFLNGPMLPVSDGLGYLQKTGTGELAMGFFYMWNRALAAKEISQLYQSPYAMFERRPVWMDYVQAASGLSIPVAMHHYKMMRGN